MTAVGAGHYAATLVLRGPAVAGHRTGKHADERAKILADKADVEPMLRTGADLVIETTEPIEITVRYLLDLLTP